VKTKISPAIVGLFVLGAFALGVIALLSFGGVSIFSKPQRFVVTFNETVHGLDLGSPVKLRGVRVGRVADLSVRFDKATNQSRVRVVCELTRSRIMDPEGNEIDVSSRQELDSLIERGLRAQLGILGLATGLLYVELNFLDPRQVPADPAAKDPLYAIMPAVPSTIAEFQDNLTAIQGNLTGILSDLDQVDFAALGRELQGLLTDSRRQLNRTDLPGLVEQWRRTGSTIESVAASPEIRTLLTRANAIATQLETTLDLVNRQVGANGAELQKTLLETQTTIRTFNETAATIQRFVQAQRGIGEDVAAALRQVSDAANAAQRLIEFLERNPNALLLGRRPAN
jgi:paraquat-inducible protein B